MLFQDLNLYQSNQWSLKILRINHPQTGWLLLHDLLMFYFFVCLFGIFRPIRELFTQMETSPLPVRGWHSWQLSSEGSSVCHTYCDTEHPYNGHLRGPVTLAPIAKRLPVELSLPVFTTYVCRGWIFL